MSDLSIVLRSLSSRTLSTVITSVTVAVAVALLLVLLTLRSAASSAFLRGSGNAHLLVSADATPLTSVLNSLFYAAPPPRAMTMGKVSELRSVAPFEWTIPIQQGDSYKGHPALATDPAFFERFQPVPGEPWKFREGRALRRVGAGVPFEIVAGATAARNTGLRVGDRIHLVHGAASSREHAGHVHEEYAFEVVGILEPTATAHDRALFLDLEASWILHAHDRREADGSLHAKREDGDHGHDHDHEHDEDCDHEHDHDHPLTTAEDLIDEDRLVTGLLIRLPTRPGADAPAALGQVYELFRRDTSITVAQPAEEVRKLMNIVGNIDGLFIAISAAVLVSSAIAIMLALHDGMAARRRQIAVLRVLGFSRGRIAGLVLTESALIGAFGALLGVALSIAGVSLGAAFLRERVGLVIETGIDLRAAILVAGSAIALGALAGIVPALAAYRTAVWRSLRPLG